MPAKWINRFELKPGVWVFVPSAESIEKGAQLKALINQRWRVPPNYFHLRRGGHVAALRCHAFGSAFAHIDIKDFFGSINRTRVTRSLKKFFTYDDARAWANESTVVVPSETIRRYMLPFGFVQSPILASLCLYDSALGRAIRQAPKKYGVTVSVYVDDIIVSSNDNDCLQEALLCIKLAAVRSGFLLNTKKEQGPSAQITTFNIIMSSAGLAVEASRMAEFMQAYEHSTCEEQRRGLLSYVTSVNVVQAEKLKALRS